MSRVEWHETRRLSFPLPQKLTPKKIPTVSLDSLSAQQLSAVKKQLDEEVEHLSASYTQLAAAQAKFKECLRVVKTSGPASFDSIKYLIPHSPLIPCVLISLVR